jgi:sugar (pentulose or hexulose) kinase
MALPSFAPGGPVQGRKGTLVGPAPSAEERAAAALLYVALMTDLALDAIRSANTIVVDGGLIKQAHYLPVLRQLRPAQPVLKSGNAEGSALGAAALAFESIGIAMPVDAPTPVSAAGLAGLEAYRDGWRARLSETPLERAS